MSRRFLTSVVVVAFLLLLTLPATAYSPARLKIINTAFTVKAGDAKYWGFEVGKNGGNVVGRFRAEGGGGNDIKCLILDGDSFENWRNGHTVKTYYNSGKITVANINVRLGPGDYARCS